MNRRLPRAAIVGSALAALVLALGAPWSLVVTVPLLAVAVTLEVASSRRWGGFWGEKNEDGSSRW